MIKEIDEKWTEFLGNFPETSLKIKAENKLFEKEVHRWAVKMSIRYGFTVKELKEHYYHG